ncbi:unnamed protein product [Moneuplotes crassus]|uniref:Uncharacterized protein n=1 Tax=Euplotes crassus TaxID=5936 RepID=A0AAD1XA10_EUPCR|nr:unnamed protein product [Moneuplotes crassus]
MKPGLRTNERYADFGDENAYKDGSSSHYEDDFEEIAEKIKGIEKTRNSRNSNRGGIKMSYDSRDRRKVFKSLAGQRSRGAFSPRLNGSELQAIKTVSKRGGIYNRKVKSRSSVQSLKRNSKSSISSESTKVLGNPQPKLEKMSAYLQKCKNLRKKMKTSTSEEQKSKLLLQENKLMREGLKEMNEFLSDFIEHIKEKKLASISSIGYKYGDNGKLKRTREEKIRRLTAESQNYKNMIANLSEEHQKYKQRIQKIKDPKFVLDLQKEVTDSYEYIEKLHKQLRNLKDDQFKREKKMNEVMTVGVSDAMGVIQDNVKQMTVLVNKKRQYEAQIQFQTETETQIDEHTENIKKKVEGLEVKLRSIGLNPDAEQGDILSEKLKDPLLMKIKKQRIVKIAKESMNKKFYTKFKEQKERLIHILSKYDESFSKKSNLYTPDSKLQESKYPVLEKINKILTELNPEFPVISSKLPWTSSVNFKPRSSRGNMKDPYSIKSTHKLRKLNSRSSNDISDPFSKSKIQNPRNFELSTPSIPHSNLLNKDMADPKAFMVMSKSPYLHNGGK